MKTGFNYCVSYGGGVGPDVWDREIEVSAVDIADAISQVSGRVKEECGWIFMVSQEDYPQTTREKFDEKLNQIRAQRDEHYGEANQLRIKVSERDRKIAELEKRDVESIKHINRVATWAQQDPTGLLHVHGIQAWVLNELKQALGAHGEAQPWTPTISLIKDIDTATRELAEAKVEIARLRNGRPNDPAGMPNNYVPDAGEDGVVIPHDTPEPSVERQENSYCEECNYPLSQCGETDLSGEPSLDCMVCKIRAQLVSVTTERDKLILKWESDTPGKPGRMLRGLADTVARVTDSGGSSKPPSCHVEELAAERDQLKAENEKLRAMVAAKDEALTKCCKDIEFWNEVLDKEWRNFDGQLNGALNQARAALSPEIANEFVRRDVLEELRASIREYQLIPQIEFHPRLLAALSRAETELAKGKQP